MSTDCVMQFVTLTTFVKRYLEKKKAIKHGYTQQSKIRDVIGKDSQVNDTV